MESTPSYAQISLDVAQVFTPNTPISERDMFSGRTDQIRKVVDIIFQAGQHAIIFGDRGTGKTSLASVLKSILPIPKSKNEILCIKINSDKVDTFRSVWIKVFEDLEVIQKTEGIGFTPEAVHSKLSVKELLPNDDVSPNDVRKALNILANSFLPVIIIDEFDRLPESVKAPFADLIKSLSDNASESTIILIGVGDSVEQLIKEHESVQRAMVQVNMPRMSTTEIKDIIINGLVKLGMGIDPTTLENIALLAKGLPHYAHLIGKHAAREALDNSTLIIDSSHLHIAIKKAIQDAQHSIAASYHKAIRSTKKVNLFSDVILACALAEVNQLGEFAAQDLREPMKKITGKPYEIAAFVRHLDEFSSPARENILIKSGAKKKYRYKFKDPLMQSFIIMQGMKDGKISYP